MIEWIEGIYNSVDQWLGQYPWLDENVKFLGVFLLAYAVYFITKKVVIKILTRVVKKTKTEYDDIILKNPILKRFSIIAPLIVFHQFAYLVPSVAELIRTVALAIAMALVIVTIVNLISAFNEVYEKQERFKKKPIKGYLQVLSILVSIIGGIVTLGVVTGKDPWAMLGGLGAMTAILMLVFKDTILSFVASIQITTYDLLAKGDWITVPQYGADGDVIDIALHTVTIQNFDKTITIVPTAKLVDGSFKNWRGMQQAGGRRIMRSIHLDLNTIKFCDEGLLERLSKIQLLRPYIEAKKSEIAKHNKENEVDLSTLANGRRMTNIGTFRAYISAYLRNRSDIGMHFTFLIRQLEASSEGLPLQIYVFTTTTVWTEYEAIQADLFDHLLAVVPHFDLRLFQSPSGYDFSRVGADPAALEAAFDQNAEDSAPSKLPSGDASAGIYSSRTKRGESGDGGE
jgi:miniconductance mechanosensitive channel